MPCQQREAGSGLGEGGEEHFTTDLLDARRSGNIAPRREMPRHDLLLGEPLPKTSSLLSLQNRQGGIPMSNPKESPTQHLHEVLPSKLIDQLPFARLCRRSSSRAGRLLVSQARCCPLSRAAKIYPRLSSGELQAGPV